jgi:hypothetical protein
MKNRGRRFTTREREKEMLKYSVSVSNTPLDGALNAEGSYWFTEPDDPPEPSVRSYVRPRTHESIIQL